MLLNHRIKLLGPALIALVAINLPAGPATSTHGAFPTSTGIYRIPYADGTNVALWNDHHDHSPVNRIDMSAGMGAQIVAAASGTIRAVVDIHGNSPNPGDGMDTMGNPQNDALEHSCQDGTPAVPNSVVAGLCQDYNNYVWIEHPNGEWTKYTHFGTGTVTANGWAPGDWINAGEVIGLEGDVGRASSSHLHFEVGLPNDPNALTPFTTLGGFMIPCCGVNIVSLVCDIANNLYVSGQNYVANPCTNQAPVANAGGPYMVDEGSSVQLDGTGSNDPDGLPLIYLWAAATNLDDPSLAQPSYNGVDDGVEALTLTVYDTTEALSDSDGTSVTVLNVPPMVTAVGDDIAEAESATVSATFTDPGSQDTHTATIDWDDGTGLQAVSTAQLAGGIDHVYGDNGVFSVEITITDDDGGVGVDTATVTVANLPPSVSLNLEEAISFPGGDYLVVDAGAALALSAQGSDAGSDDLTFTWNVGPANTFFNDGLAPDPFPSPLGVFPFAAADAVMALFGDPGVEQVSLSLSDDDGAGAVAMAGVIVTGLAQTTNGQGWWKHQYSGNGSPHIPAETAEAYAQIVAAVSSVFSELVPLSTAEDVHAVLSPTGGDARGRAESELLQAWLHFASGAVSWDATVPLAGKSSVAFLDLMFAAEGTISDPGATDAALGDAQRDLARVRHAE